MLLRFGPSSLFFFFFFFFDFFFKDKRLGFMVPNLKDKCYRNPSPSTFFKITRTGFEVIIPSLQNEAFDLQTGRFDRLDQPVLANEKRSFH